MKNVIEFIRTKYLEIQKRYPTFVSYVIYCCIGFTGLTVDLLIYNLFIYGFHISPYISNIISMFASINNNFFLNTYFNFKKTDKLFSRWLKFCSIGVVGIFLSDIMIAYMIDGLSFSPNLAKIITIPIIATIQFVAQKIITYNK